MWSLGSPSATQRGLSYCVRSLDGISTTKVKYHILAVVFTTTRTQRPAAPRAGAGRLRCTTGSNCDRTLSFLIIHGLFFLAHRDLEHSRLFVDFVRRIDQKWDALVPCIRDGKLPDVQVIDHVRRHLQASTTPSVTHRHCR